MRSRAARVLLALSLVLAATLGLLFVGTACSTSLARIESLLTVEPYAFAVQLQLLRNFALEGEFFQTIHRGYDDAWTWSGHRSFTFLLSGLLCRLDPSAMGLSRLQILGVALGALPAAALGRRALGSAFGFALGAMVYLLAPTTLVMALQDYQDLVFALPCLMFTLWAFRTRHALLTVAGALVGCMPREECVPLVIAAALVTFGPRGLTPFWTWLRNVLIAGLVVALWSGILMHAFPIMASGGHDTPLVGALDGLRDGGWPPDLPGLPFLGSFYPLLWAPSGFWALLSPLSLLPALGLFLMHLTVPLGHGVDRFWSGHVHHLAPCLPFLVLATIEGLARVLRALGTWIPRGEILAFLVVSAVLAYALRWDASWAEHYNLVVSFRATQPSQRHPAWELVGRLPSDAMPVVPTQVSLAVADRRVSYTFNESLFDKAADRGLGAGTHLIVSERDERVVAWGLAMPEAVIEARSEEYLLITWERGAKDPSWKAVRALGEFRKLEEVDPHRRVPGVPPPGY
jgi:uncharacterized membrane protein